MTIEIGFGRPWWITRRSIVADWALHSRGWSPGGRGARARAGHWTLRNWHSPYVRIQMAWWGVVFGIRRNVRFYQRDDPRFRMLVGFVCEEE
jgi:hypothetical protein